ncbi:MAG TPA: glycosyltransferase [Thermoanaerobaculia bacterium]|nr:glycosyltransferase [Thermoanaerobaculia bacterium]
MRLLHVVPTYLPARRYGGTIVSVHGLCRALAARGHQVDVFTTNVDGGGTLDVPIATPVELDGVRVHYFPSPMRRLYWSPQMRRALKTLDYDLVHIHAIWLWPGYAAARAAHRANVPYVISPRGMLVPELIQQKSTFAKRAWLAAIERRNFAAAAAIHFTSRIEQHDAERTGVSLPSPFVVPNGVDLVPRPDVARDENTLLFLGRINWKKGLDRTIELLPRVDARLLIAGNDEENLTPSLRALAAKLGVADRVEFTGPVYGDAKWELMARATLFVLQSMSENFGNAVLEALMMETPAVLTPRVGLAEDVVRANAGTTALTDVAALLADRARREAMGRNGRALVEEKFTWPRVAAAMEEAYQCTLTSRR